MTIHPKVMAGGLGGSLTVVVIFIMTQFGIYATPDVSAAMATIFSFIAGYLMPNPIQSGISGTIESSSDVYPVAGKDDIIKAMNKLVTRNARERLEQQLRNR